MFSDEELREATNAARRATASRRYRCIVDTVASAGGVEVPTFAIVDALIRAEYVASKDSVRAAISRYRHVFAAQGWKLIGREWAGYTLARVDKPANPT